MDKRFWLWLLPVLLFSPQIATAQPRSFPHPPPPRKQSHHPLQGELDLADIQDMMAQRLRDLRELHELQDKVQELLNDDEFRNQFQKFKPEELQRLRDKLLKGEGLSNDPKWEQLLQNSVTRQKLNDRQIEILRGWARRAEHKPPSSEAGKSMLDNAARATPTLPTPTPSDSSIPPPSLPAQVEAGPSVIDRLQEETTKWLIENFDNVSGDVLQTLTEMGGMEGNSSVAELLRSVPKSDFSGLSISEHPLVPALRDGTLSRYFSNAGDFLHRHSGVWDKLSSLFYKAPLPSLPNVGSPSVSMRSPSTAESDAWLPVLLCLLMLGAIVLFLRRRGFGSNALAGSGSDKEWRLGSWPVSPGAVSTRQDVIRAFEYLALLCLGPAAATHHHRQLAEQLAEQDNGNPARRQAVQLLAWLYEQARYAPAGETLSQEQLSDARHALCSLAGVTTA